MNTEEKVTSFLSTLPSTPEGIRDKCREENIKGISDELSCPMALLIFKHTGVLVRVFSECIKDRNVYADWKIDTYSNFESVCRFVNRFDSGEYMDLIAERD